MGAEVFHALKGTLKERGLGTTVGDEGGFAPDLDSNEAALEALLAGIEAAGLRGRADVFIALDPATSELYDDGAYVLEHEGRTLSPAELADYWAGICDRYPVVSLEDGMDEEDWDGWKALTERLGERVQLVGDDLFVTNPERLRRGIERGRRQLDPGQAEPDRDPDRDAGDDRDRPRGRLHDGDLPPLRARPRTRRSPTSPSPPAPGRSRPGRPSRSDRVAKYNQLLRIEEELGERATYPGIGAFAGR